MYWRKLNAVVLSVICSTGYNCYADNNPEGLYLRPHAATQMCGDKCDLKKQTKELPEGWEKVDVNDSLEITNYSEKKLTFELIKNDIHVCNLGGEAVKKEDGFFYFETDDTSDDELCLAKIDTTKYPKILIYISKSCRSHCGARNSFDEVEKFDGKISLEQQLINIKNSYKANPNWFYGLKQVFDKYNSHDSFKDYANVILEIKNIIESEIIRSQELALKKNKEHDLKEALSIYEKLLPLMLPGDTYLDQIGIDKKMRAGLANDFGFVSAKKDKNLGLKYIQYAIELDPSRAIAHLNIADLLWDNNSKEKAKIHYQNYAKLTSNKKLPQNVLERCRICGEYAFFKDAKFTSKNIVGNWKLTDMTCSGDAKSIPKETTQFQQRLKEKKIEAILAIENNGQTNFKEINPDKTQVITESILKENNGTTLEECTIETSIINDKKTETVPCSDTLRKFSLETKNEKTFLKRTTLEQDRASQWCTQGLPQLFFEKL